MRAAGTATRGMILGRVPLRDADDQVAQFSLKFLKAVKGCNGSVRNVRALAARVARGVVADYWRGASRQPPPPRGGDGSNGMDRADNGLDILDRCEREARCEALRRILAAHGKLYLRLDRAEAAVEAGVSPERIDSRKHHFHESLRAWLAHADVCPDTFETCKTCKAHGVTREGWIALRVLAHSLAIEHDLGELVD
jgi:DNA-directed RNA polymerase specialized sigma24 family protein